MKNRIKFLINKMDKPLLIITTILLVLGLLNIVTASSREAVIRYDKTLYYYFFQHLKMISLGLILYMFIINLNLKAYKKLILPAFIGILCILLYLLFYVQAHKGAQNWIRIMGFSFQPSEFSKPVIIVYLALLFEKYRTTFNINSDKKNIAITKILFVGAFIPVIIFLQKDFGTMFIIFVTFGVMFLASPIRKQDKKGLIGSLTILLVLVLMIIIGSGKDILTSKQKERFNFINPCGNYEVGGYQVCTGFIGINEGGLFGVGIGKSKQKYSYIPEPHTDSIFIILAEENGLVKTSVIFILYLLMLKRILLVSSKSKTDRGKYIALGVATYIFMHILVNLGGFFGLLPLTGVPLPFLSYGGSFIISLLISLALVQRVAIETNCERIKL